MKHGTPCWLAFGLFLAMSDGLASTALANLRPRPPVIKPEHTTVDERHQLRLLTVKFQDGLHIRVRDERLTDFGSGELDSARPLLDSLGNATWLRVDSLPEANIEQMRQVAQTNLGCAIADLNLQFNLRLPPGTNMAEVIDAFNALEIVELAQPTPRPGELFAAPDLQPLQGYLFPPTNGINAFAVWTNCGARGAGIKLADIGCSFNTNHIDLPIVPMLDGDLGFGEEFCEDHGTATLGVIGAKDNGNGTTGIAPDCSICFVGVMNLIDPEVQGYEMNIPGAVMTAIGALTAGDVLYFEMGANGVPADWDKPVYDRVVLATGLGITVVEPAGNGQANLDDPIYSTGNGGHWPFLPSQDSGAIIVGGGQPPAAFGGSSTERSRTTFSNYGSTVDLQGWSGFVATTGPAHGLIYNAEGNNNSFGYFFGTSAAGPVVAGACVLLQSAYKARTAGVLTPAQVKQKLQITGSPQQAGQHPVSENIGPLPNVKAAIDNLFPPVIVYSRDRNTVTVTWKACCILQVADHLGPHATWTNVPTIDNTYTYTHGPGPNPPPKFFRLFCP
jgi:serine protease